MPSKRPTLYLCEKPSQARDIARVLGVTQKDAGCIRGRGLVVTWCLGHLLEMAPPEDYGDAYKRWSLDALPIVPREWRLTVRPKVVRQFKAVKRLLAGAARVVVATDADREGETIARELLDFCGYRGPLSRLWLSALDDASIRKALANLFDGDNTLALYRAGLGRARADWLVGMNLTRAYTVVARQAGYDRLLPVGRVQTPTLRLVVDRDRSIEAFKPAPYWNLIAWLAPGQRSRAPTFGACWRPPAEIADAEGRCLSESAAHEVAQRIAGATARIDRADTKHERAAAPLPYDLGTLQQEANRIFGLGAQAVLDTVQALYETRKAVTYPRTDCRYLPVSMHAEAGDVFAALAQSDPAFAPSLEGADAARRSKAWNDAKITAHHAIIPTASVTNIARMSANEKAVYELIRGRYVAQFYPDFEADRTTAALTISGEAFRATGQRVCVAGWKALMPQARPPADEASEADPSNTALPKLRQGDTCLVADTQIQAKQTRPPARFTEGTLIAAMKHAAKLVTDPKLKHILKDTAGLGTEATRAAIIAALLKRGFLRRQKKKVVSTEAGRALITALPRAITDPETTALWEQALDDICDGRLALDDFTARQARWVKAALDQVQSQGLNLPRSAPAASQPAAAGMRCPDCGRPLRQRQGKHGAFWGCSAYPKCKTTRPDHNGQPGPPRPH